MERSLSGEEMREGEQKEEEYGEELQMEEVKREEELKIELQKKEVQEEESRAGEVQEEESRAGEVQEEESRAGEVQGEESRAGEVQGEESRAGEVQGEESRAGEVQEESRAGEVQGEESRAGEVQGEESRAGEVQGEESRAGEVQGEESRAGEVQEEESRTGEVQRKDKTSTSGDEGETGSEVQPTVSGDTSTSTGAEEEPVAVPEVNTSQVTSDLPAGAADAQPGHSATSPGNTSEEEKLLLSENLGHSSDFPAADFTPGMVGGACAGSDDDSTPTEVGRKPAPPNSLPLSGSRARRKRVLVAPALSLSLGDSTVSDEFPSAFLSPSFDDEDDTGLDIDLDAMETPSDSESLHFPILDLDVEEDLRRLGVSSRRLRFHRSSGGSRGSRGSGSGSGTGWVQGADLAGLGPLEQDLVDVHGTRWRRFTTGHPPQESTVNMSVLEPYLRVLSHGGYCGDGIIDIIIFSSCYLPENSLENYHYVMDNLFRYVVGTLELMVQENYVMVYLCAMAQKEKLPGIGWLRECYTTIDRRLRKNLKALYMVHPTWYIKALITIIKPFISSKFSRKLQFVPSLQELSRYIPTEHVQIPDCVRQYDESLDR